MTGYNDKPKSALDRLNSAFVSDILSASDQEILAEAEEDGLDLDVLAEVGRAILNKAQSKAGKARLVAAREALVADRRRPPTHVTLDPVSARRKLDRLIARSPDAAKKLTLAARNETSGELSDEEVRGLLEDFEELGFVENGKTDPPL